MATDPPVAGYLDALFGALRAWSEEIDAAKRWLARAEQTESTAWRLTFLRQARAALDRSPARLVALVDQLAALGPVDGLPPPLDRIPDNVVTLEAEVASLRERLSAAEASARPIGRA